MARWIKTANGERLEMRSLERKEWRYVAFLLNRELQRVRLNSTDAYVAYTCALEAGAIESLRGAAVGRPDDLEAVAAVADYVTTQLFEDLKTNRYGWLDSVAD